MSLPLQAESPVLVTSIKVGEVELVGRLHYVAVVRSRPRTLGTWGASLLRVHGLPIASRRSLVATSSRTLQRAWPRF